VLIVNNHIAFIQIWTSRWIYRMSEKDCNFFKNFSLCPRCDIRILCPRERRVFQSKLGVSSSNQCNLHHSAHTGHLGTKNKEGYNLFRTSCIQYPTLLDQMMWTSCKGAKLSMCFKNWMMNVNGREFVKTAITTGRSESNGRRERAAQTHHSVFT
jgi:hypothetical protein